MNSYLSIPLIILKFWYFEAPRGILGYFGSLNKAFFDFFSLPLFLKTYFKPLKNEYRQGLVGFSRAMGIIIKTGFIVIDLIILATLLVFEIGVIVGFLAFPILTFWMLFV